MWTVPAEPRYLRPLAVKPDKSRERNFLRGFQIKAVRRAAYCVCFYCGKALEETECRLRVRWCAFTHHLHPLDRGGFGSGSGSGHGGGNGNAP